MSSLDEDGRQAPAMLLVSLLALTTFAGLFVFRSLDDNRLTSWQWAFAGTDIVPMFAIVAIGVALAYLISAVSPPASGRVAGLFVSSFAAAALFWGAPEVIVDAARYFLQAKHLELHGVGSFLGQWGESIAAWTDLPLIPFLHGLAFTLFGETRLALQAITTLLFAATAVVTYLTGRTLWDETVGGVAGVLLLGMPFLLTQPALMLVDVPTMFFLTLAVFTTIKAVRDGGAGFLAAAPAAIVLAMLSKYSTWVMLSVLPVIVVVHLGHDQRAVIRRAALVALATLLLAGTAILLKFEVVAAQIELLWVYQMPGLSRWGESHVSTFLFQTHPFVSVAALASVFIAIARRDARYAIICWMLLLVMVLGVKRSRYILVTLPMLALMAGYALREISNGRVRRFIVISAVASALATAAFGYLPLLKRTSAVNLMLAGAHLDSMDVERVEVHVLPQTRSIINPAVSVPILDLFTQKRILYRAGAVSPPPAALIATSPLRFTWEMEAPPYLLSDSGKPQAKDTADAALVVIASREDQPLPEAIAARISGRRLSGEFAVSDRIFRYKTIVRIYGPR
ncbi:MAG: hypothetical protein CMM10_05425 [Rhodospirillaceae bacterium]|nr:hypothetical protein [Rhodospirillaceae bacterium]